MTRLLNFTLVVLISLRVCHGLKLNYTGCDPTKQILNIKTLECTSCQNTNTIPDQTQKVPTNCICPTKFEQSKNGTCTSISVVCLTNKIFNSVASNGAYTTPTNCIECLNSAYPNAFDRNKTRCVPCPLGSTYSESQGTCTCNGVAAELGCFSNVLGLSSNNSVNSNLVLYQLAPACLTYNDIGSCSRLLNYCAYKLGQSSPQCDFFSRSNRTGSLQLNLSDTNSNYKLTAGQFSKGQSLKLKIQAFYPDGTFVFQRDMTLSDLFRCGMPANTSLSILIGSNIVNDCKFNFNDLAAKVSGRQYKSYLYQLFILGTRGEYFDVAVYLQGSTIPLRRFFLQDSFTDPTKLRVAKNLEFIVTLNSARQLVNPSLYISYITLSLQKGVGVVPISSQVQTLSFKLTFSYNLSQFWSIIIPIFITVSVLALINSIGNTYIGYLNRRSPFVFLLNCMKCWSMWMFYFLLVVSFYWFVFTKTTPDVFVFLPNDSNFYAAFYAVAGAMGFCRIIPAVLQKLEKLKIEVFMINWERGAYKNSWREIFIINSLAQFYTYRTISLFWILFIVMLFLTGFGWEKLSAQTVSTDLSILYSFYPKNRVLNYFLGASIFLVVGFVFKIVRRLISFKFPYPFQDLIDYCTVTNISFFFIRKRSPQAFYIHASIPEKMEGTYKEINNAINRNTQKERTVLRSVAEHGGLRLYIVYMSTQLQNNFHLMLKKLEDEEHGHRAKYSTGKKNKRQNYRDEFIENKLKPKLQQIARQGSNNIKNFFQYGLGTPPVHLRDPAALRKEQVYYDQYVELLTEVFPNGNQIEDIHTLIIVFLMWNLLINSTPIAAFLTYFVDQFLMNGYISYSCRKNLERMTKVREGFML